MRSHPRVCWLRFKGIDDAQKRGKEILERGDKRTVYFVNENDTRVLFSVGLESGEIVSRDKHSKKLTEPNPKQP